ncbi:YdeI/OmpD-associated family protein [Youngiibacter multivorans]|uniref:DUF1905 domain-containing protein n=1 Tax=Youngiibacter multivorans TaxID=937251 RepID=A0ABS4G8H7_9CLOT|nr:hypothetical protein [Youngiibacter multivorans]
MPKRKMNGVGLMLEFDAIIVDSGKGGAYVEVPFDIEKEFGSKRIKADVRFDGVEYRGSIMKMGTECYILGITKDIQSRIGKTIGDNVSVRFKKDEEERTVAVPDDVRASLESEALTAKFEVKSYTFRKKHITGIEEAKAQETRTKRIQKLIEELKLQK